MVCSRHHDVSAVQEDVDDYSEEEEEREQEVQERKKTLSTKSFEPADMIGTNIPRLTTDPPSTSVSSTSAVPPLADSVLLFPGSEEGLFQSTSVMSYTLCLSHLFFHYRHVAETVTWNPATSCSYFR